MNAAELDELWSELERELAPNVARVQRRLLPAAPVRILAWCASPSATRSLAIEIPAALASEIERLPEARGLRTILHTAQRDEPAFLELQLVDENASDVFSSLVIDVATSVAASSDARGAVDAWLGRLARWQKLLTRAPKGLTPERQRALYSELWCLRELLFPAVGIAASVTSWQLTENPAHDFQLAGGSVEVKSTVATQPQEVRINGERQLDETGTPSLHLLHVSLDVHRDSGETLPHMVASVRSAVSGTPVEEPLGDRLLDYGYLDVHEPKYRHVGYTLRESGLYRVGPGFPRIIESDLQPGVGGVSYILSIAACAAFRADVTDVMDQIRHGSGR